MVPDDILELGDVSSSLQKSERYWRSYLAQNTSKGENIMDFVLSISKQLHESEEGLVLAFVKQINDIFNLNDNINDSVKILDGMKSKLFTFDDGLGRMEREIDEIQVKSKELSVKLENRKDSYRSVGEIVDGILLTSGLITKITDGEINEFFVDHVKELGVKANYLEANKERYLKAWNDISPVMEAVVLKAIIKIRTFFLKTIEGLKTPQTNISVVQQSLLKYKELFRFLMERFSRIGGEVRMNYLAAVQEYYGMSFSSYISALIQHQKAGPKESETIAAQPQSKVLGFFGQKQIEPTTGAFEIGDRLLLLLSPDADILLPQLLEREDKKYPFSFIFKSITRLLMDNTSSSFVFSNEFFLDSNSDKATKLTLEDFETALVKVQLYLETSIQSSFDAISLLTCIRLNCQNRKIMQLRKLPHLESFFDFLNIKLWGRFKFVVELHLKSCQIAQNTGLTLPADDSPHRVSERYGDFASALLLLNQGYRDPAVLSSVMVLRKSVLALLESMSSKANHKSKFWVVNVDAILKQFSQHNASTLKEEVAHFEGIFQSKMKEFIDDTIGPPLGIMWKLVSAGEADTSPPEIYIQAGEQFNQVWKKSIENISSSIKQQFSTKLGEIVLHETLKEVLICYKAFLQKWDKVFIGRKPQLIPVGFQTLLVEMKKYKP